MYEKIQKISEHLRKENENSDKYLDNEIKEKFKIYKDWLIENGAIFDKNIDFPITYGPFHKIGCKSKLELNENEAIILIPKSLIITTEDSLYIENYIKDIIDDLSEEELPTIYLTLNLYLEKQNKNSFYKPYLDIIFLNETNNNYTIYDKWDYKSINELNDEICIKSFENMVNSLEEIYNLIKQCGKFSNIPKNEFLNCFFTVVSKKINLNDSNNNSALVPLTDLFFEDNSMKLRYEIYDSENLVFKYTSIINDYKDSNLNLYMTKGYSLPINKPTYNKLFPIILNSNYENESDSEDNSGGKEIIKINKNDFFSVALSKNENISKNCIICNCQILNNKKMLKNKGFCLLYNRNDYLSIKFNFNRGELLTDKYLENIFGDQYQTRNDNPIYNTLKIKIEFNNISTDLLKYYRFMHFYKNKKNAKEYFKYNFNIDLEINLINLSIDFLKKKLNEMEIKYDFNKDFIELENEIYNKKESDCFKSNLIIFRLSQKIILKNQIELLNYIEKIMVKYKKDISGYNNIFDYINNEKIIIEYDKEEFSRMKILRFIAYMSKSIDLL